MPRTDTNTPSADHFREEDWASYARQPGGPGQTRLQQHLDSGCQRCARAVRLWSVVSNFAAQESSYEPPADVVRQLADRFRLQRPPRLRERVARAATLLFDSLRQPLPAGVRASAPGPRHMLFRAGRYVVKLRLEPQPGGGRTAIVGQIVDEQEPGLSLHDVAVLAQHGKKTLDRTFTNELGEFLLEPEALENLQFSVALPSAGTFVVRPPGRAEGARRRGQGRARTLGARGRRKSARPR
jgi:hypothetical protein